MQKYKIEFLYNPKKKETDIFIWFKDRITDKRVLPGELSSYTKDKIQKEIREELVEAD